MEASSNQSKKFLLIALVVVALGLVGYQLTRSKKGTNVAKNSANVINVGNGAEPKDLDPHNVMSIPEWRLIDQLFEGLVRYNPNTNKNEPGMAESYTVSKDGKTWTFKLREATWSDGTPVTAEDFVYSYRRLVNPKTASEYAGNGFLIKNGEAINTGKAALESLGVSAPNPRTLIVELENPTPYFDQIIYHSSYYPVPKHAIEKHGMKWTRPENIVSNGPFVLERWEINKVLSMKRNEKYWDVKNVALAGANFYPTENLNTEEKMFRTGQLHMTYETPPEKLDYWRADKSGVFTSFPYLGTYAFRFNVTKAPLNDKRVRKALALALDRERIVKFVSKGGEIPDLAYTPPGTGGSYTPNPRLPKDASRVAEAKKLLSDAGYGPGKKPITIELLYNTAEGHKKIAETMQAMWKEYLGIDVKLINQEWKSYLASMRALDYDISRAGWIGDYDDPYTFLDMWMSNNPNNQTGWANAKYDALMKKSNTIQNQKERFAVIKQAEDLLMEEMPILPVYIRKRNILKATNVVGHKGNLRDSIPLKYMSLSGQKPEEVKAIAE